MKRTLFRTLVVAVWLILVAWLLRFEAFPEYFTRTLEGYRGLLSKDVLVMDSWMRILFNGTPIGYSHTLVDIHENDPLRQYEISSRLHIRMKIMGELQNIHVNASAYLDVLQQLQTFAFTLTSQGYTMDIKGLRQTNDRFSLRIKTPSGTQKSSVTIPRDAVIYSPMTEMAMRKLEPGTELTLRTFDPTTLSTLPVRIRALREETIELGGVPVAATALSSTYQGVEILSWINRKGEVLRQNTPFGWVLEKCTADEASQAIKQAVHADDMLTGMAVPCDGPIRSPRGCAGLRLRLKGVLFTRDELTMPRQHVLSITNDIAEIRVTSGRWPDQPPPPLDPHGLPPDLAAGLEPTPSIQSTNPAMVEAAQRIAGKLTDPKAKARAIHAWVFKKVDKTTVIGLPTALDVLQSLRGDCNEHTYLFVALARAAGIPARVTAGLAYNEGAFYYHAWPAVYVGEWVEMDPTWGQETVDATHLAMVSGELSSQLRLVKLLGQLRIEVIEEW